jgi:heme/copper-type cytochrome/quinol oxidase subunit 3
MSVRTESARSEPRSPTTGEPVSTPARRNRLGIWLCIASDATGTVALLVAYAYLWSLNVNGAWAPPGDTWAAALPFWLLVVGLIAATAVLWWGVVGIRHGRRGRLIAGAALSSLIVLATWIGQLVQLSTFPFGPSDGAYASATFWLALANAFHLFTILFLTTAILGRTRAGRITTDNPYHANLVAMWMTWVCVAAFLGALFATTMTVSPNSNPPSFGIFSE